MILVYQECRSHSDRILVPVIACKGKKPGLAIRCGWFDRPLDLQAGIEDQKIVPESAFSQVGKHGTMEITILVSCKDFLIFGAFRNAMNGKSRMDDTSNPQV